MKKAYRFTFARTAIASALMLAFSPASTLAADEMKQLTQPDSEITAGVGVLSDDAVQFGQYTGVRSEGLFGQIDARINQRDNAIGTWLTVTGRNLGRSDAEFRLDLAQQGQWRFFFDINRTPRYEPLSIATRNTGFGTDSVTVVGTGALSAVQLKTVREALSFGVSKQLTETLDASLAMKTEDKDGIRFFGQTSHVFVPEPVNTTTDQWEAKLGYTTERLQLAGGYYGSRYHNAFDRLAVTGGNATQPIALSPDNLSHQIFASGGFNFTPTTRGTFKASFTTALQDDAFFTAPTFPGNTNRLSLDGQVDTTLLTAAVTTRPIERLSLLASVRYEDRDDKTPISQFVAVGTSTSRDGFNVPLSRTSLSAKGEASYRLPANYKVVAGLDYEEIERSYPPVRQASWRGKNDEITGRVEVRKSLSDSLNGAIKLQRSARRGSNYLEAGSAADADVIAPVHFVDRDREKIKLLMDWVPIERLSVQFAAEQSVDDYRQRDVGPNKGTAALYSVDASYALSDDWQITGWITRDETIADGGSCAVNGTGAFCGTTATNTSWQKWYSRLTMQGDAGGLGVKGKVSSKLSFGADGEIALARSSYRLTNGDRLSTGTGGTGGPVGTAQDIPKHTFRQAMLKAYADYAYRPDLSVRAQVVHQRMANSDWLWTDGNGNPYYYGGTSFGAALNNTVVSQPAKEIVNFLGVSLTYKWW